MEAIQSGIRAGWSSLVFVSIVGPKRSTIDWRDFVRVATGAKAIYDGYFNRSHAAKVLSQWTRERLGISSLPAAWEEDGFRAIFFLILPPF